ncbi:hypothetical protein IIA16_02995, partial [bacterium]|nr:hypothetical protein [bacterium]
TVGLLAAIWLSVQAERQSGDSIPRTAAPATDAGLARGFVMVLRDRYLGLIAVIVLLLNLVNTNGEIILGAMVDTRAEIHALETPAGQAWLAAGGAAAPERVGEAEAAAMWAAVEREEGAWIGSFYSGFFFLVNMLALTMQLFLVSRLFKWIGVRGALFLLPLIALGGYALVAFMPVFGILRAIKIVENGTDYSLNNTSRHALFLPVSREAKYAAKPAIDTFFHRLGDIFASVLVVVGLTVRAFAFVNLGLVALWLWAVWAIWRHQQATAQPAPDSRT